MLDLSGSGIECLPADENDLPVLEVEALRQEGGTRRGRAAPVKEILVLSFLKNGFEGLKIGVPNQQKVRFF